MTFSRPLILASQSPNRRKLLEDAGFRFSVHPADIDETLFPGEQPEMHVLRLARAKACAIMPAQKNSVIIACDTIVEIDGEILGKPRDAAHARAMLAKLSGRTHRVWTGLCVRDVQREHIQAQAQRSEVTFIAMTERDIEWYVSTGEPLTRAGSYALQGDGAALVEKVEGSRSNVIGLPMELLKEMLQRLG